MNHTKSANSNQRSPMTLGDFIKTRKGSKSTPGNKGKFLKRQSHSFGGCSSSNPGNLLNHPDPDQEQQQDQAVQIDFSVNDIQFDKINSKDPIITDMKWSVNDVQFSLDNGAPCGYGACLQNDQGVRPFNNFRLSSYSSDDSDLNNEHLMMPESSLSYFPFERVEDGEDNPGDSTEDEGFYGTIYYSLEDQIYHKDNLADKIHVENVGEAIEQLEDLNIKQTTTNNTQEGFEEDEELNNLVLSIIDDE